MHCSILTMDELCESLGVATVLDGHTRDEALKSIMGSTWACDQILPEYIVDIKDTTDFRINHSVKEFEIDMMHWPKSKRIIQISDSTGWIGPEPLLITFVRSFSTPDRFIVFTWFGSPSNVLGQSPQSNDWRIDLQGYDHSKFAVNIAHDIRVHSAIPKAINTNFIDDIFGAMGVSKSNHGVKLIADYKSYVGCIY